MKLDHVVIVVADLRQAIADYQELGFTVAVGGRHADGRTHNALIPFADGSYLELIAFLPGDASDDEHPWWRFARGGGGLADWAVLVDDLDRHVAELRAAGVPVGAPRDGGRLRPDGVELRWRVTQPAPELGLPFLIQDLTPRELRVASGTAAEHANGVAGIAGLALAVPDLRAAAEHYAHLLGVPASAPVVDPALQANVVTLPCGDALLTLAFAAAGPLDDRLRRYGPGPYALTLRSEGEHQGMLDRARSHGAVLDLVGGRPAA